MYRISRRQFFQFAGSTLATLGLSQLNIQRQAERYGKVLAQSTPRKLALLVGINKYRQEQQLRGCFNDVELQRHLLIYRFGFNPKDIYTLTDEKATRQGILEAFEEHLIRQAKPGDVVVYHYSGHGSRVLDPDPIIDSASRGKSGVSGTFVPVDSSLPSGQDGVVEDIMGHTLFLLMSALKSENFTAVLDSCYSGGATRKEFQVRSRDNKGKNVQISPKEKSYQEQWLSRLKLSREDFIKGYQAGIGKGVVLAATAPDETAADAHLNGFYAGAFTYELTQYLWKENSTVDSSIAHVIQNIPQKYNQTPRYEVKVGSGYEKQPIYFINTPSPVADAVITEVKGNQATLWLGGVDVGELDNGTVFTLINGKGKVTLRSRDGLVGVATVEGAVQPGVLLRKTEGLSPGI
jgi:hypothetical protein